MDDDTRLLKLREVLSIQPWIRSYIIMIVVLGNPPSIQDSRDGRTYPAHGNSFSESPWTDREGGKLLCVCSSRYFLLGLWLR